MEQPKDHLAVQDGSAPAAQPPSEARAPALDWIESEAEYAIAEYPHLTMDQARLYALMSDISEDCYCAGWMSDNEYTLWDAMLSHPTTEAGIPYGLGVITHEHLAALRTLAAATEGWIYWHNDDWEPGLEPMQWGPRFMKLESWLAHLRQTNLASATQRSENAAGSNGGTAE